MSDNVFKKVYKLIFPKRQGVRTNEFFTKNFMQQTEPMNPETRQKLVAFFRSDIEKLSKITGRNLDSWLQ